MRTMVPTVAGLLTLRPSRDKPPRSPQPRQARPNSAPLRRSNWSARGAAGVGIAVIGGTVGATGIGGAAFRNGDFGRAVRLCTSHGPCRVV
jgi:hypothetical protein